MFSLLDSHSRHYFTRLTCSLYSFLPVSDINDAAPSRPIRLFIQSIHACRHSISINYPRSQISPVSLSIYPSIHPNYNL
ncbi:hypothetical protein BC938DRAFT_482457 [Jimgerdemannia flammicorona]|uniref:Uncharacterized protein n=1 Tax=Jimgerdemannia flammicorona TaxID=994334 RepID=A0A433QE31_9FUNG|nr:hypothetical protein BC938DRAFT_482457 [Jimgerdemannia flammicorona]